MHIEMPFGDDSVATLCRLLALRTMMPAEAQIILYGPPYRPLDARQPLAREFAAHLGEDELIAEGHEAKPRVIPRDGCGRMRKRTS